MIVIVVADAVFWGRKQEERKDRKKGSGDGILSVFSSLRLVWSSPIMTIDD